MADVPLTLSATIARLAPVPGPTLTVKVERTAAARAGEEHFTTFSPEAVATNAVVARDGSSAGC